MLIKRAFLPKGMKPVPNSTYLLHFEGTNGSTTITDSSVYGHTGITTNSISISTERSKFGTSSLKTTTSGYISIPVHADLKYSNDWTIDFWLYPTIATYADSFSLAYFYGGGMSGVRTYNGDGLHAPSGYTFSYNGLYKANQWQHVAITRTNGRYYAFWDGNLLGVNEFAGDYWNNAYPLFFGNYLASNAQPIYYDEFRFVNNVCEWTSSFTPPTAPYTS